MFNVLNAHAGLAKKKEKKKKISGIILSFILANLGKHFL